MTETLRVANDAWAALKEEIPDLEESRGGYLIFLKGFTAGYGLAVKDQAIINVVAEVKSEGVET